MMRLRFIAGILERIEMLATAARPVVASASRASVDALEHQRQRTARQNLSVELTYAEARAELALRFSP
jgi:hypothetical protein